MTQKQTGIFLMILSAFIFALMQIFVNLTSGEIPLMEQVFIRNTVSFFVALFSCIKTKQSLIGEKKYQPLLFARSFFGYLGVVTLFYASSNAFQADVTVINKTSPFIITLLAVILFKEKVSKIQVLALITAFLGVVISAGPKFSSSGLAVTSAILSAVFSAIAYTCLSYFRGKVDGMTVILHFSAFSMIASIPFLINDFVIPSTQNLFFTLCIGICGSLGQICITYAYRFAPAGEISIYNYTGIIFSMILGYTVLGENIGFTTLIGSIFVVAGSLMVYFNKNKKNQA